MGIGVTRARAPKPLQKKSPSGTSTDGSDSLRPSASENEIARREEAGGKVASATVIQMCRITPGALDMGEFERLSRGQRRNPAPSVLGRDLRHLMAARPGDPVAVLSVDRAAADGGGAARMRSQENTESSNFLVELGLFGRTGGDAPRGCAGKITKKTRSAAGEAGAGIEVRRYRSSCPLSDASAMGTVWTEDRST